VVSHDRCPDGSGIPCLSGMQAVGIEFGIPSGNLPWMGK